jgi:hypothetical protein
MNPTEQIVYITLHGHRLMKVYEERVGQWRDGCSCFWTGPDHDEHVAAEVTKAIMPGEKPVVFPGRRPKIHRDQMTLMDVEVPDRGYKGIRL